MKHLAFILSFLWCIWLPAAETLPARPALYFNDYANAVSPATVQKLNEKLAAFERDTSSQVVVAVYPHLASNSSVEDYTHRLATDWQVGQKDKRNGVVLFVFLQEHKLRIEVGYGLEGALPDAICKRIIDDEIAPRFRNGDMAGGLTAGVDAMLAAVRGEYKGTGYTVQERHDQQNGVIMLIIIVVAVIVFIFVLSTFLHSMASYTGRGRQRRRTSWWDDSSGGGFLGGGSWSSGGGSGGSSSSGFSGGGGSFGGGGASGSW